MDFDPTTYSVKAMEKVRSPDGGKLKIVEKVGQSIVAGLKRNDPYKTNSNEETDCTQKGTVYQVQCQLCPGTSSQDSIEEEEGDSVLHGLSRSLGLR